MTHVAASFALAFSITVCTTAPNVRCKCAEERVQHNSQLSSVASALAAHDLQHDSATEHAHVVRCAHNLQHDSMKEHAHLLLWQHILRTNVLQAELVLDPRHLRTRPLHRKHACFAVPNACDVKVDPLEACHRRTSIAAMVDTARCGAAATGSASVGSEAVKGIFGGCNLDLLHITPPAYPVLCYDMPLRSSTYVTVRVREERQLHAPQADKLL